jgi:osmotically-inducible protein OsmY
MPVLAPPPATTPSPLVDKVEVALSRSPYLSPRDVSVEAAEGVVRLTGAVRSFFQKQMAQELIRRLDGVERIENLLQVTWNRLPAESA